MDVPDMTFWGWVMLKFHWMCAPVSGSLVGVVVGKDFSMVRVISGVVTALFSAYYFTEWIIYYMPMPPDTPVTNARSMVGALVGLTSYFVVNRMVEFIQEGDIQLLGGFLGFKGKGK